MFYDVNVHLIWHTIIHSSFKTYSVRQAQIFNISNPKWIHENNNNNRRIHWEITCIDKYWYPLYKHKSRIKIHFKVTGFYTINNINVFGIYKQRLTRNFERHIKGNTPSYCIWWKSPVCKLNIPAEMLFRLFIKFLVKRVEKIS